jgi:hypothetical protein
VAEVEEPLGGSVDAGNAATEACGAAAGDFAGVTLEQPKAANASAPPMGFEARNVRSAVGII